MSEKTIAYLKEKFQTDDYPSQQDYADLIDSLSAPAPDGWRMLCGVLRRATELDSWEQIAGNHVALHQDAINVVGNTIEVDFTSLGASDVVSMLCGADDTFCGDYHFGGSVGTTKGYITIKKLVISGTDVVGQVVPASTLWSASGNIWYIAMMKKTLS